MPAWAARAAARVFLTSDRGVWAGNARCRPNFFAARRHDDRNEAARSVEWTRAVVRSKNGFELRKNINYKAEGEATVEAVLIGSAVMRGVKMHLPEKVMGGNWLRVFRTVWGG